MNCDIQLAATCLFTLRFSAGNFDPKVGHTDPVSDVRSGFISRSVHARLQVSVCSGYDLPTVVNIWTHAHRCPAFEQLI